MLPDNDEDRRAAFLRWTGGRGDAAAFLALVAEIARLADDIADEDLHRQRNVAWLLHRTMVDLPRNPFFAAHAAELAPLVDVVLVQWRQSDEWRKSCDRLRQLFGFVQREAIGAFVPAVAAILGGPEAAKAAADDFFATCHAGGTETVEAWAEE